MIIIIINIFFFFFLFNQVKFSFIIFNKSKQIFFQREKHQRNSRRAAHEKSDISENKSAFDEGVGVFVLPHVFEEHGQNGIVQIVSVHEIAAVRAQNVQKHTKYHRVTCAQHHISVRSLLQRPVQLENVHVKIIRQKHRR
jgi:hypothetical protein